MDNSESWLEIGRIVAAQGLKGELKVMSSSDFPERFEKPGTRWLQSPDRLSIQEVELVRGRYVPGKNLYVIKLAEIADRTQAETLRDYTLLVPSSDRPQLNEGEYHVSDLINLTVYHQQTGEEIGVVTDMLSAGNDLLEVQLNTLNSSENTSSKKVLIPFVYEIVPVVDLVNKRIEINPPVGLLELS
ncbi:16S rRNA processing protein RimM [Rippkaea orientalis PCC 8801]|uniref:Ribosome maturation factor RimM n=1 Tax=Rippkaea orientalis (strain PCC 8801 / RF-1) TaxID=41431 RepID=RIMM_RIPO1|nr:ribosome maturation factor RimM [Rippkaea orientalis]B7K5W1.1 RecName: Full=Ribosome maturation factor RimM [Rippkaea orientalis PCC 8801]ACK68014.1 16S rRNA processing protein RimM [Rippkaea orientalis PCC 8801]